MNFAGNPLLSKPTITSGRSLTLLSLATILTHRYEIDLSTLRVLDISLTENQLNSTLCWVLGILWITHIVHWVGDYVSLGKWNTSMSKKSPEGSIGAGKMKTRLEFVIQDFERVLDPNEKSHTAVNIKNIEYKLQEINKDCWWHEKTALFYVVGWYFLVPTVLMGYAIYLVIYG